MRAQLRQGTIAGEPELGTAGDWQKEEKGIAGLARARKKLN